MIVEEFLSEKEARPAATYFRLRQLAIESARIILQDEAKLVEVSCPACDARERTEAFTNHGYHYQECSSCGTLYISPRPTSEAMKWYLLRSPLAEFRRSEAFRQELHEFSHELAQNRADWIVSLSHSARLDDQLAIVDVQERYSLVLANLTRCLSVPLSAVTPLWATGSEPLEPPIHVIENLIDLDHSQAQLVTAFDVIEHLTDPASFVRDVHRALAGGGYFALTTRAGSGFDIQALWDKLDNIFPLEHTNLISTQGMTMLLQRTGFDVLEMSTPGQLDVQVVTRLLGQDETMAGQRLLRLLTLTGGEDARRELQHFLQKYLLSSFMRVVACKR
jgi:SAM-dependent methyltransferase